jgi:outer membrane protein assembly factor BamD
MNPLKKISALILLIVVFCLVLPARCPAPLVWRKGEGWSYERNGQTTAKNPKEQLEIGKKFQEAKDYGSAISAYRRLIKVWPTAFAVQDARLGLAESLNAAGYHYKAYKVYQDLIEKHPNSPHFETALQRQFEIGNLFLAGEKHKPWMMPKIFPAMDKAINIFEQIVKTAPFSKVGPEAQLRIGTGFEKQKEYLSAVHAYEKLLERYPNNPLAETAQFRIGKAYQHEAARADYDQNNANQAIIAFTDFTIRYPKNPQVEEATQTCTALKLEQAKGLYRIGEFYEKGRHYKAALIYYDDVIEKNPQSVWAESAQKKVAVLTAHLNPTPATK